MVNHCACVAVFGASGRLCEGGAKVGAQPPHPEESRTEARPEPFHTVKDLLRYLAS